MVSYEVKQMLKFIGTEAKSNDDELPWAEDYFSYADTDANKLYPVLSFQMGKKGVFAKSADFKVFFYAGSAIEKFLLDAIKYWKSGANDVPGIYFSYQGKVVLCFDDEVIGCKAVVTDRKVEIQWGKSEEDSTLPISNPFLSKTSPLLGSLDTRASKKKSST